nr:MAG TPA: hypothetical protein [Caudoviricetes sp.]
MTIVECSFTVRCQNKLCELRETLHLLGNPDPSLVGIQGRSRD